MHSDNSRMQLVVKSNDLIQRARYKLSLQEQKIILFVISKIKPEDYDLRRYKIDLADLCDACGIEHFGQNYKHFRSIIYSLYHKDILWSTPDKEGPARWIHDYDFLKKENAIEVELSPKLKPHLLMLRDNFTQYELGYIMVLHSKHSIRLYELFKSYAYAGTAEFTLEEFRDVLQIEGYDTFKELKRRVIDPSIEEINQFTDLSVSYTPFRRGRAVADIVFEIERKSSAAEVAVRVQRERILGTK